MTMTRAPKDITVALLEVVVMPNGEIICAGQSIGWLTKFGRYVTVKRPETVKEVTE